ncbi:MAG: DUF1549 and DUF1553 domain-containing protein [Acidobacteria bacterium]|nr:DUF1549 and DUF1553 domain-containing protein [Acidobacteriota bacterium]
MTNRIKAFAGIAALSLLLASAYSAEAPVYSDQARSFWSFQPRKVVDPPQFEQQADRDWIRTPIDAFLLERMKQEGLRPAPEADRATLIRRAYFDMLGLPPTPAEVAAFVNDQSPTAWESVVDRLLTSEHYGERWGQHWLDVVRYAETEGYEYDRYLPGLWRYRDYVIQSLNEDKPFNEFIREQIAGDEMVEGEPLEPANQEKLIAAGFYRLGAVRRNAGNQEVASSVNEVLTDRTDIVGAAFLGLTVGCARCHDHMFDPIKQRDYYQLQAFLAATAENDIPLTPEAGTPAAWRDQTKEIGGKLKTMRGQINLASGDERAVLESEYAELEAQLPPPPANITTIKDDHEHRPSVNLLYRGDYENKGEQVGMRPLGVLLPEGAEVLPADTENPRMILANWLADPDHPLTSRVMVNRIWSNHFGTGFVKTANDFGFMGEKPSHPELFDWLSQKFVDDGWRMKPLHRMILLSSVYRQASKNPEYAAVGAEKDGDNRLLSRMPMRRLTAEEIRDSILAVSGSLNTELGGRSIMLPVEQSLVDMLYDPTQWVVTPDPDEQHKRSVYLIAKRNLRLPFMEVFDQPALQTTCARRDTSTHAPQSLELLNGRISNEQAEMFAARLISEVGNDPAAQVKRAYEIAAGRQPSQKELQTAQAFLEKQPLREFALAVFNLNAFLYVN